MSNRFVQRLAQPSAGQRTPPILQPRLRIGSPGDRYEREADSVARGVAANAPGRDSPAQDARRPSRAGRAGPRESSRPGAGPGVPAVHLGTGGRPLGRPAARPMEQAFGTDFSSVRVHSDVSSDGMCRQIGARAFTVGDHIFFRRAEQPSGSASGRHLLAHELTHVVQQRGTAPAGPDAGSYPGHGSAGSVPRGTIQAFWVLRGSTYHWRTVADRNRFVKLRNVTRSSREHGDDQPVYVEPWERGKTKLQINPVIEDEWFTSNIKKRGRMRRSLRREAIKDLRLIRSFDIGRRLLRSLATMRTHRTYIEPSPNGPDPEARYNPGNRVSTIAFHPPDEHGNYDAFDWVEDLRERKEVRWRHMPSDVVLFHELVHAYHNARNTMPPATVTISYAEARNPVDVGVKKSEYQAVGLDALNGAFAYSGNPYTENKYRTARELHRRSTYRIPLRPEVRKARARVRRRTSRGRWMSAREDSANED